MKTTLKKVVEKVKTSVARPRVVKGSYVAVLEFNGEEKSARGATALEAVNALSALLIPFILKTKCFLRLEHKKRSASQLMLAIQLRRFINGKTARAIQAKRLEARLA